MFSKFLLVLMTFVPIGAVGFNTGDCGCCDECACTDCRCCK